MKGPGLDGLQESPTLSEVYDQLRATLVEVKRGARASFGELGARSPLVLQLCGEFHSRCVVFHVLLACVTAPEYILLAVFLWLLVSAAFLPNLLRLPDSALRAWEETYPAARTLIRGWARLNHAKLHYAVIATLASAEYVLFYFHTGCTVEALLDFGFFWPTIAGALLGGPGLCASAVAYFIVYAVSYFFAKPLLCPDRFEITEWSVMLTACLQCAWVLQAFYFERAVELWFRDLNARVDSSAKMLLRDVRTPLHGLLGCLEELSSASSGADDVQDSDSPHLTALGCALAIESVLENVSHQAFHDGDDRPTPLVKGATDEFSINTLALRARSLLRAATHLRQSGHVNVDIADKLKSSRLRAQGSAANIVQIVGNLLSNAAKFTPENGTIDVAFRTRKETAAGTFDLVIEVEDSGPGVPQHEREKIFQLSYRCSREEQGRGRATEGFGLGLSIVFDCVNRLGGGIRCETGRSGSGALFLVEIPVYKVGSFGSEEEGDDGVESFDPERLSPVLLVDDNALNLKILRRLFLKAGFHPDSLYLCGSAEEALKHRVSREWHLAVLDLVLPGKSGLELTRDLLAQSSTSGVIVAASASLTTKIRAEWQQTGAQLFMAKPFKYEAFLSILASANELFAMKDMREKPVALPLPSPALGLTGQDSRTAGIQAAKKWLALLGVGQLSFSLVVLAVMRIWVPPIWFAFSGLASIFLSQNSQVIQAIFDKGMLFVFYLIWNVTTSVLCGCNSYISFTLFAFVGVFGKDRASLALSVTGILVVNGFLLLDLKQESICTNHFPVNDALPTVHIAASLLIVCLFHLSRPATAIDSQSKWIHTLSHDVRGPLQGVLVTIPPKDRSSPGGEAHMHIRTCATALIAAAATALEVSELNVGNRYALENVHRRSVSLREVIEFVREQCLSILGKDVDLARITSLPEKDWDLKLMVPRWPLFFVMSKVVYQLPLNFAGGKVVVQVNFLREDPGDSKIVLSAEMDSANPPLSPCLAPPPVTARAVGEVIQTIRTELGNENEGDSMFTQALAGLLKGSVDSCYVGSEEGGKTPLKSLRLVVPIPAVEHDAAPREISPEIWKESDFVVADDSDIQLAITERILRKLGAQRVHSFRSRAEALAANFISAKTVFLLDLHMSDVSGPRDWMNFIQKAPSGHIFVACTGDDAATARREAEKVGFHAFLAKPFTSDDLDDLVARLSCGEAQIY